MNERTRIMSLLFVFVIMFQCLLANGRSHIIKPSFVIRLFALIDQFKLAPAAAVDPLDDA